MTRSKWSLGLLFFCGAVAAGFLLSARLTASQDGRGSETVRLIGHDAEPAPSPDAAQPWDGPDGQARHTLVEAVKVYETKLAMIANNLANAETPGFKRSSAVLEDCSYRHERMPGNQDSAGEYGPCGISIGRGVRLVAIRTDFRQGAFWQTGRELDVAIDGLGFFQVTDPNGHALYTRAGAFSTNANGALVMGSADTGRLLEPPITIPCDAMAVVIGSNGTVSIRQPGSSQLTQVGQLQLAYFVNTDGLLRRGENLLSETDASGTPTSGNPGQESLGTLRQGALEASNVDLQHEQREWDRAARRLQELQHLLKPQ